MHTHTHKQDLKKKKRTDYSLAINSVPKKYHYYCFGDEARSHLPQAGLKLK